MVQKKLSQKKPKEKAQEKCEQENAVKNELNGKDAKAGKDAKTGKDENNNKCVEKKWPEFCPKQNHFVCQKFSDEQFNHIREQLIKVKEDKELVAELDINHLNEILEDHHLQTRYMMRQRYDLDKQFEFIMKALKWREENYISKIRKELFPREPFELGPVFPYKRTKTNEIVVYLRFCLYPHQQIEFMDEFSIYQLYVINRLAIEQNTTWCWFFDFSHATKSNIDIKRSRFMIDVMNTYFPFANSKSYCYNLPWYLSFLKPLFFGFLPASIKKVVGFVDSKNLTELIDQENLPPFLGGPGALEDCELYRTFTDCKDNYYLDDWIKNPPKEIELFREEININEVYEKSKVFLQKQKELIESLQKKGVII